jgi:hypothetical protein
MSEFDPEGGEPAASLTPEQAALDAADLQAAWPISPVPRLSASSGRGRPSAADLKGICSQPYTQVSTAAGITNDSSAYPPRRVPGLGGVHQTHSSAVLCEARSAPPQLFGTSPSYHRGNWTAEWMRRLQRLDHAMIFSLIAGTAIPAFLTTARGTYGRVGRCPHVDLGTGRDHDPSRLDERAGAHCRCGVHRPGPGGRSSRFRRCGSTPASRRDAAAIRRAALHDRRAVPPPGAVPTVSPPRSATTRCSLHMSAPLRRANTS